MVPFQLGTQELKITNNRSSVVDMGFPGRLKRQRSIDLLRWRNVVKASAARRDDRAGSWEGLPVVGAIVGSSL